MTTEIVRPKPAAASETNERRRIARVCAWLALAALAIYAPVYYHNFLNYDDGDYVLGNEHVNAGLTRAGLIWAFGNLHGEHTYWHPVTWVSHMLDCQLFGLNPGPPHLVNVFFHIANTLLLFLVLKRMTGALGRSAMVAALFSLHPLQVDTVAWVAERKNVLSTLFWLLTIWAYVRYGEVQSLKSKVQSQESEVKNQTSGAPATDHGPRTTDHGSLITGHRSQFYLLSIVFFALGLMAKPALVTLPFVLLLLDYWPLRRFQLDNQNSKLRTLLPLLWEKLPFLALAAAASFITVAAHEQLHSLNRLALPLDWRIANAVVSYVRYLGKAVWPAHLAVFYPHPGAWPAEVVAGSGLVVLTISGLVTWRARVAPYLVTGWLWFLGVLVPMIGIIQGGDQAMADRFAYVPLIGLFIMIVWGLADRAGWRPERGADLKSALLGGGRGASPIPGLGSAGLLALGACALLTSRQLPYWQNTVTLFEHALAVTPDNATAHLVLGNGLESQGRNEQALAEYRAAVALVPSTPKANYNLALLLQRKGRWQEAAEQYEIAIRGYEIDIGGNPEDSEAHFYLAEVLQHLGRTREVVLHLRKGLRLTPDSASALNNLAWFLATSNNPDLRNGAEAVQMAKRACELTKYQVPIFVGTLAAAYAEAERFAEAVATAQEACALAAKSKDQALLRKNQELLELYRAGKPYREPATPTGAGGNPPASLEAGLPSRR